MEIMKYVRAQWDRALGVGALIAGIVALILGYFGISGTPHVAAQLPYFISGGLVGIFLLGVAGIAWLSADLRDEWRELHSLRESLDRLGYDGNGDLGANGTQGSNLSELFGGSNSETAGSR
jgi:hypothetical protein